MFAVRLFFYAIPSVCVVKRCAARYGQLCFYFAFSEGIIFWQKYAKRVYCLKLETSNFNCNSLTVCKVKIVKVDEECFSQKKEVQPSKAYQRHLNYLA